MVQWMLGDNEWCNALNVVAGCDKDTEEVSMMKMEKNSIVKEMSIQQV